MKLRNTMAALAIIAVPLSVGAQQTTTLTYNLTGEIEGTCGVFDAVNASVTDIDVDFGTLNSLGSSTVNPTSQTRDIVYVCNNPRGFDRTITSRNGGQLETGNGNGNRVINYTLSHTSSISRLDFSGEELETPIQTSRGSTANPAFLSGVQATLTFDIPGGESVLAGTYTDVVTLQVVSN